MMEYVRTWGPLAVLSILAGCDELFGLDQVRLAADAADVQPVDAPVDVMLDAPSILKCSAVGTITLVPTEPVTQNWADQVPATGSHLDKIAEELPDEDVTYIASASDGQLDLFAHAPIDGSTTIDSVTIWTRARLEGSVSAAQVGAAFMVGNAFEWDDVTLTGAWSDFSSGIYTKSPATQQSWTVAEVNAMTFGVRKAYNTYRVRVTRVWAIVTCH
jgi:hypothetical protein